MRNTNPWISPLPFAKAIPSEPGHHEQRANNQHPPVSERVHNGSENERPRQDAERQQRRERADAVAVQAELLGQHVVHRTQRQEDDAEQQHAEERRANTRLRLYMRAESIISQGTEARNNAGAGCD